MGELGGGVEEHKGQRESGKTEKWREVGRERKGGGGG